METRTGESVATRSSGVVGFTSQNTGVMRKATHYFPRVTLQRVHCYVHHGGGQRYSPCDKDSDRRSPRGKGRDDLSTLGQWQTKLFHVMAHNHSQGTRIREGGRVRLLSQARQVVSSELICRFSPGSTLCQAAPCGTWLVSPLCTGTDFWAAATLCWYDPERWLSHNKKSWETARRIDVRNKTRGLPYRKLKSALVCGINTTPQQSLKSDTYLYGTEGRISS